VNNCTAAACGDSTSLVHKWVAGAQRRLCTTARIRLGSRFSTTFVEGLPALHTFLTPLHVVSCDRYYTNGGSQSDAAPKQSEASND